VSNTVCELHFCGSETINGGMTPWLLDRKELCWISPHQIPSNKPPKNTFINSTVRVHFLKFIPSHVLRPVTPSNAPSSMSYRNCWHIFSPRLLWSTSLVVPCCHENASSSCRSLTKIPHCCRWWIYLKTQVAVWSLKPARGRRLSKHTWSQFSSLYTK